jgi:hypothetical protein
MQTSPDVKQTVDEEMTLSIPLQVYSMVDRETETKTIRIKIKEVPSLMFISSLISKIENAKKQNLAEEF